MTENDQRGHGRTAEKNGMELGNIATKADRDGGEMGVEGGDAFRRMLLDVEEMILDEKQRHPGLKTMLFGHSMGSIVAQMVAGQSGEKLGRINVFFKYCSFHSHSALNRARCTGTQRSTSTSAFPSQFIGRCARTHSWVAFWRC